MGGLLVSGEVTPCRHSFFMPSGTTVLKSSSPSPRKHALSLPKGRGGTGVRRHPRGESTDAHFSQPQVDDSS
jgi:hypothetical protein